MSIPDYTPLTKSIKIPRSKTPLVVRGLSIDDVAAILHDSLPDVVGAVEMFRDGISANFSTRNMDGFILSIFKGFPRLSAEIVARAADDPAGVAQVLKYPLGVQISALLAVAELSLEDMADLSDPSPALASLVRQVTGALASRPSTASPTSTGASDEPHLL